MTATAVRQGNGRAVAVEADPPNPRELELAAIIDAYNRVTEKLKASHETLAEEVRRLRKQLRDKDRALERRQRLAALGEMAAGVAHEVRNPLGGILLYADMLQKDLAERAPLHRMAQQVATAARRLDKIVADVLAFAGNAQLQAKPVLVGEVVEQVVELLHPVWQLAPCEVVVNRRTRRDRVVADPVQLQRAFLNLVSNAIDAAGAGGRVRIDVDDVDDVAAERVSGGESEAGSVRVVVADSGAGVPVELRDKIFNPFFTTRDSGTGLGLAIVHRIVERHGGRIAVAEDEALSGARFIVSLPSGGASALIEGGKEHG